MLIVELDLERRHGLWLPTRFWAQGNGYIFLCELEDFLSHSLVIALRFCDPVGGALADASDDVDPDSIICSLWDNRIILMHGGQS